MDTGIETISEQPQQSELQAAMSAISRGAAIPADGDYKTVVFVFEARHASDLELIKARLPLADYQTSDVHYISLDTVAIGRAIHEFSSSGSVWLQAVRVSATLAGAGEKKQPRLRNLFFSEPGQLRRRWIAKRHPERIRLLYGEGATLDDLEVAFEQAATIEGSQITISQFIVRRAIITLERAERLARGARYKIAKLLTDDIFASPQFEKQLNDIAKDSNKEIQTVRDEAKRYLHEMGALQTPFTLDLLAALERKALSVNHDPVIDLLPGAMDSLGERLGRQPVVFLISHKSMLDIAAFLVALYEANLPMPLTFGGINLKTPGFGALARRAGIIFLRRTFQDNAIYKATFRRYIDYLIEKRFSLQWALEGTRSRTGKLLPPRFGLFNYVIESILRTGSNDVAFVPVSVAFDQITEVADYAREQRGMAKKPEGATWFLRFFKRKAPHGRIFVRFGDPVQVDDILPSDKLGVDMPDTAKTELVQLLALRVAVNMNSATPITTSAIVTLILLASGKRAQSIDEIARLARAGTAMIRRRRLEIVGAADFKNTDVVQSTLKQLAATGIVTEHTTGISPLYSVTPDQHYNAAYYRNTAIHFFILDAIAEMSLLHCGRLESNDERTLLDYAGTLREYFKFEFYFPRRADYQHEILAVADSRFKGWREALGDSSATEALLLRNQPLLGHAILRSFVDAYRIACRHLKEQADSEVTDRDTFIEACLPLGRHLHLQERIFSVESVSKILFEAAYKMFGHQGLLAADQSAQRTQLYRFFVNAGQYLQTILDITLAQIEPESDDS